MYIYTWQRMKTNLYVPRSYQQQVISDLMFHRFDNSVIRYNVNRLGAPPVQQSAKISPPQKYLVWRYPLVKEE